MRPQALSREVRSLAGVAAVAGDEEARPLVGDAQLAQLALAERGGAPGAHDGVRALHADAGHAQERLERRLVHLHGEEVQVVERPVRLRVHLGVQERVLLVDDLGDVEAVEAQEPVRLVEPVLAVELQGVGAGQARVVVHGRVGAEEHALERERAVERGREVEYLEVALGRGPHDHLRGLAGGHEGPLLLLRLDRLHVGRVLAHERAGVLVHGDVVADLAHGGDDLLLVLLGGEQGQALLRGQLHVHAHAVGQMPQLVHELGGGAGHGLGVDVAAEAVLAPQERQRLDHELGGVVGALDDARA